MTNITTDNIRSSEEAKLIDNMIRLETERKLLIVPKAKDFKVSTACVIDGEFRLLSGRLKNNKGVKNDILR
tara:strand:+ start:3436 stop:3648 length:213 start_codon:yes stop_codon:yes gene_type:complete